MWEGQETATRMGSGRVEREVSVMQVFRMNERLCHTRLVGGALPPCGAAVALRLAPPTPQRPARPQPAATPRFMFN